MQHFSVNRVDDLVPALQAAGVRRGTFLAVAISVSTMTVTFAADNVADDVAADDPATDRSSKDSVSADLVIADERVWAVTGVDPATVIGLVESEIHPRWIWWSNETPTYLSREGVRVATCWDLAAVHRLLFGGWRADPARLWAMMHDLSPEALPSMGQLGLLDNPGDEGSDPDDPIRPDRHLRPEWVSGGWELNPERCARWSVLALQATRQQEVRLFALPGRNGALGAARSESAAELLCVELGADGLPVSVERAEAIIGSHVGPRPRNEQAVATARERRDAEVLRHAPPGSGTDLRNPAHVRSMLTKIGIDVTDTRAWRLEPFRESHPLVDALLTWRKAERISTTYGYTWLDEHVDSDGRLRGAWTACDGAAGRMTAQAGLHNLPAEMRDAVIAEPGYRFVHADLGQIEPRVLAAVSTDAALAAAASADDLYAPVAARLSVDRAVAKVAVLAAMYGQTSGAAGEALRGMETAYPVAMQFLRDADRAGQAGRDVRTYGGRLVRMGFGSDAGVVDRSAAAARGRYARNAVVQGAAAELFKAWAVTVRARLAPFDGRIVLCLHDELLLHVPIEHAQVACELLESALPEAARRWMPDSSVRYVAKARILQTWSEAKG